MKLLRLLGTLAVVLLLAACDSYEPPPYNDPPISADSNSKNVIAVSAAANHTLALLADGTLWSWGHAWGGMSPIGDGTTENRPRPVQIMQDVVFALAGHDHSLAITSDGTLWAWGANQFGQIGDGTTETRLAPVPVMENIVYAAMLPTVPNSHTGAGGWRTYAIDTYGVLWGWGLGGSMGYNPFDVALGDGGGEGRRLLPVRILENVRTVVPTPQGGLAITNDSTLWIWHGEIIDANFADGEWHQTTHPAQLTPAQLLQNVAAISANGTMAVTTNGTPWDIRRHLLEEIPMDGRIVYAIRHSNSFFAITDQDELIAWGENRLFYHWRENVTLGDGTTIDRDTPVVIMTNVAEIKIMGYNVYVLCHNGGLWTWGVGYHGDWGDIFHDYGHMWEYAFDAEGVLQGRRWLLDDGGGTGLRLRPELILDNVASVAPTYNMFDHGWVRAPRAFAVTTCGTLWAWGNNDIFGQGLSMLGLELGDGTSQHHDTPIAIRIMD